MQLLRAKIRKYMMSLFEFLLDRQYQYCQPLLLAIITRRVIWANEFE